MSVLAINLGSGLTIYIARLVKVSKMRIRLILAAVSRFRIVSVHWENFRQGVLHFQLSVESPVVKE